MSQERLTVYRQFGEAVANNNVMAASASVYKSRFRCLLPGLANWLNFSEFWTELERQRAMFSDFGQRITTHNLVEGDSQIAAWYTHEVTFDGTMTMPGSNLTISPTGRVIKIRSMEIVTFDPTTNLITQVAVESDRLSTTKQMRGMI